MINGRLYIDGLEAVRKPLAEGPSGGGTLYAEPLPNGARYQIQDLGDGFLDNTEVLSIGPDQWFLMGDNRDNAIDSRADGSVPTQAICATVYARQQDGAWVPL